MSDGDPKGPKVPDGNLDDEEPAEARKLDETPKPPETLKVDDLEEDMDIPGYDPYPYQDCHEHEFPFILDVQELVFIGRVGEEPLHASFTISNPTPDSYLYKVKSSCPDLFSVKKTMGVIEKESEVVISVTYYALPRQPPYTQYLEVHALISTDDEECPHHDWLVTNRLQQDSKRIYVDFLWHPHVGLSQALVYGKLYEKLKKTRGWKNVDDMIYQLRKKMKDIAVLAAHRSVLAEIEENDPQRDKRLAEEHEQDNNPSRVTAMAKCAKKPDYACWVEKAFPVKKEEMALPVDEEMNAVDRTMQVRAINYLLELKQEYGGDEIDKKQYAIEELGVEKKRLDKLKKGIEVVEPIDEHVNEYLDLKRDIQKLKATL